MRSRSKSIATSWRSCRATSSAGSLTPDQAMAAQIEIGRRILALDEGKKFLPARPPSHRLTLAMVVILPLAGFGLYLLLG